MSSPHRTGQDVPPSIIRDERNSAVQIAISLHTGQMFSIALTTRQRSVLGFIVDSWRRTQLYPSLREIQRHFDYRSINTVWGHLAALEKKGAIQRLRGKSRAYKLRSEPAQNIVRVPFLGSVPAGMPTDAATSPEEGILIDAAACHVSPSAKLFALQVRGDSMNGAAISDGDIVIIEPRPARHGDIVAALIDQEVTLKRLVVEASRSLLRAENPRYPDLVPESALCIQGVMVALFRGSLKTQIPISSQT